MTDTYNATVEEEERRRRERLTGGAVNADAMAALAELSQRRDALADLPSSGPNGPAMPSWEPRTFEERERFDDEMNRWRYGQSQALRARLNISTPSAITPDNAARRQRNAELYGSSALSTDLQEMNSRVSAVTRSPVLTDFYADETNAILAQDDVRPMSFFQVVGDIFRMSGTTGDFGRRAPTENRVEQNMRRHIGRGVHRAEMADLAERENPESALDEEASQGDGSPITRRLSNMIYRNSRVGDEHEPITAEEQNQLNTWRHDEMMGLTAAADMGDNFGGWFLENIVPTAQGFAEIPTGALRGGNIAWERAVRNWEMGGGGTPADVIERIWAVTSVAPDMAVSGAMGAITGPIAYTYQQEAGNAYLEFTQHVDEDGNFMDRRIAGAYARDVGVINSAFEIVNLTVVGKFLGAGKLAGFLASSGVRSAFRRYAMNEGLRRMAIGVGGSALSEGATEALQETSIVALGEMARLADSGVLDMLSPGEVAERLFETIGQNAGRIFEAGVAGAVIGGGISTVVAPITIGSLIEDARVGEYQQGIWTSIEQQAESSKLRERAPGVYDRLVSKLLKGTPLEQVAINVEDFIGAFNQDVDLARAAARELTGVGVEAFDQAQQSGGDIFIPASTMSSQIAGTAEYKHISEHSKIGPDVSSIAEVRARLELGVDVKRAIDAGTKMQEQLTTLEEAKTVVRQEFFDRLKGSEAWGQDEFNAALAELFTEGWFTIASAAGIDPSKMPKIPTIIGPFGGQKLTPEQIAEGGFATMPMDLSDTAKGARGMTAFERSLDSFMAGAKVIFTETRDESTATHEIFGHYFLELMRFAAAQETATPILKQDWQTTLDYLGMTNERWEAALKLSPQEAAKVLEPAHEKFARAIEVYFYEGRAPSPRLKRVFRMFKIWMMRAFKVTKRANEAGEIVHPLYQGLMDDRIRPVFDRMFASKEAIAEYAELMGSDEIMTRKEWGGVGNKFSDAAYERYRTRIVEARRRAEEAVDAAAISVIVKENMRERRRAERLARKTVDAEMAQDPVWIAHDVITGRFELPQAAGVRLNSALVFQEYGKSLHSELPNGTFDIDTEGLVVMAMEARGVKEPTRLGDRVRQLGIYDPSGQIERIQGNKKGLRKADEGRPVSEAIDILWSEGWFGEVSTGENYFQGKNQPIAAQARDGSTVFIVPNPTKNKLMSMTTAPLWDRDKPWDYDTLRYVKTEDGTMYVAPAKLLHDDLVAAIRARGVEVPGYLTETSPNEGHGNIDTGFIRRQGDGLVMSKKFGDTYNQDVELAVDADTAYTPPGDNPLDRQNARTAINPARGRAGDPRHHAQSWRFTRASGRAGEGFRVSLKPVGVHVIADITRDGQPNFIEIDASHQASVEKFHASISAAKAGHKFGASVHVYSPEEYAGMRLFLTEDGKTGGALKPDGDIVSCFSSNGGGSNLIQVLIAGGGTKADAFDTVLPELYSRNGLKAVARVKFNDEFAPDGWDYEAFSRFNNGRPDVVFMVYDPAHESGYVSGQGETFPDYDSAVAAQASAVLQAQPSLNDAYETYLQPFDGNVSQFGFSRLDTLDVATGDSRMRVSTRQPTGVKSTEDHIKDRLAIGLDSVLADPAFAAKVAEHLRGLPNMPPVKKETAEQTIERYIDHVVSNLLWLHDSYDAETRDRADEWYVGARALADTWMIRYGLPDYVIAGTIAALSPQLDWFQNVSLAERTLDVYSMQRAFAWTPEMQATADRIFPRIKLDKKGQPELNKKGEVQGYQEIRDDIDGRSIADIERAFHNQGPDVTNTLVAAWVRIYDQTYNDPAYRVIMPEGVFGDFVKTTKGKNARVGWKSNLMIANAISMIKDHSYENISKSLGAQHKVRNFYNNILAPNAPHGDVTIDTHAVAAAQLRPLSGNSPEVIVNLSGPPKSKLTGSIGAYGVNAEAYRRAATARGIQPRQMQSITWEAIRTLFEAEFKVEENNDAIEGIWREYRNGKATIEETRQKISDHAGGIKPPTWVGVRSADGLHASEGHSTYQGEVPTARLSRWDTGVDARAGRPAADRIARFGGERYFQLEEAFDDRRQDMIDRIVSDVGLDQEQALTVYRGLIADHNVKMIKAMRLQLALDVVPVGRRADLVAEATVDAVTSQSQIVAVVEAIVHRYGESAAASAGAPITMEMRDQIIPTTALEKALRERTRELAAHKRNVANDPITPERKQLFIDTVTEEIDVLAKEIEARTQRRPSAGWEPSGGMAAVARATDEEVLDWFHNSGEVRVSRQRNGDPVIFFKTDPSLRNTNAKILFDENAMSPGEFTAATDYRGRFNNRDWQGQKRKPTARQRSMSMAFFARMALISRAFILINKPERLRFAGGSESHEKLYTTMLSKFEFSGYTARIEKSQNGSLDIGSPASGRRRRQFVAENVGFVLMRPDVAALNPPRDIPPTAVSQQPFVTALLEYNPNMASKREPGEVIWFSEETIDVKNPTGAEVTRDPAASEFFKGRNTGAVRFVPIDTGRDGVISIAAIAAKERAVRTLDEAEGWFYQKEEPPTEGEFLDALRDDVSGVLPVYRSSDVDAALDWAEALRVREFFARRGIDLNSKPAELRKQIELAASQLDDRGIDADTMASIINAHVGQSVFGSGREMLEAVSALPSRGEHIKQRIDQIVRDKLGDPMDDLPSAASLSMHNIDEEQRILMELQATKDAAGTGYSRAINKTARDYAERRVERLSVKQVSNPDWFLNTERRWAKAAIEASRKGDTEAANKAKFNQLVNFHIYKMVRAANTEMERTKLYFKNLQKLSARTRISADYYEQIEALLDQYELRKMSGSEIQRRISLTEWVQQMEEKGLGHMVQIDPDVIARAGRVPFTQLTVEEARALRDAVRNIEHLSKLKDKLLAAADKRSFELVLAGLIGRMAQTGPVGKDVTRNYSEDEGQRRSGKLRRWNAALTRMEFLFRYIDGQHNGELWRTLFLPFAKAADVKSAYQHRVAAQLTSLWENYSPTERASMFKTRITVKELTVESDVTGTNDTYTRMELIAIALNVGNMGNVAALVDGFDWFAAPAGLDTDYADARKKIIAALDKHLTKRDWEFVQETWGIIGQFRDQAFDLHQRLTGLRPEAVEAEPVISKHGQFAGGYYPLKFDPLRDAVTEKREAKENTPVNNWGVSSLSPMTKKGHLIDRKGSGGRPVRLDFAVATDHIQNVVHDISYREALIDANRIISDSRFRAAFIRTVGKEQYAQLHPWLHSIAVEYRDPTSDIGKLMQKMRGNMQVVTMGIKFATATQQLAGLTQAMPMIGGPEVMGGIVRMLGNPLQLRDKAEYIMAKSEFMRTRVRSYNRDVREFLRRVQDDTVIHKTQRNAFALVGAMDWAVSSVVWIASYEKARAGKVDGIEGGVEEDAVRFADSVVRQTQSAGLNQDLPLVMRNTEMEKLVTAFYSYFSVLYNWTTYDQVLGARKGRVPLYMVAGNFFLIYILAPLMAEWLAGRWEKEGEDDEERMQRMMAVLIKAPFSTVPILRDVAGTFNSFYEYSLTPFEGGVQSLVDAAEDVASGDILSNERAQKNAAFAVGFVFGLPTAQAYITLDYVRDYAEGEEEGLDLTEALLRDTR